ncbi:glycoside hydrolase family 15 protein [Amorphus sp. 3PC139-8]|uniref:glycoside hydrolase family 15 protein n=1 Tax=Amorphus sp. 3PC139-8 TaxID=2735676 RepID=UPI00345E012D
MDELTSWLERQQEVSRAAIRAAISRTDLVHARPGFGFEVRPKPGSVLASPVSAHYDPDPDYFFHWFRDAAVVMEALRFTTERGTAAAHRAFRDYVHFNSALLEIEGAEVRLPAADPAHQRFLRPAAELAAVRGETVAAESRVNPDGTLDVTKWGRPQMDGPALRALSLLRWWPEADVACHPDLLRIVEADLRLICARRDEPSFDIWEEEAGRHYYVDLIQAQALREGAARLGALGVGDTELFANAATTLETRLDRFRTDHGTWYASRLSAPGITPAKRLDMSTIFAVLHAGRTHGPHSPLDPIVQGTMLRLQDHFASAYQINREGSDARGPAMGRYPGDRYVSGGAFYFSTLAAAEFHFRLAARVADGAPLVAAAANFDFLQRSIGNTAISVGDDVANGSGRTSACVVLVRRGDAFLETVRAFTPASGALSEQFDQTDGHQTSAKDLAWSHAALLTAAAWRRRACQQLPD